MKNETANGHNSLSERQRRMLAFLKGYIAERGYPPSIREIREGCGISSTSVAVYNLDRMHDMGVIRRDPANARAIAIPGETPETIETPVDGPIGAETPADGTDAPGRERIRVTPRQAGGSKTARALLAADDSLAADLIAAGDYLVIEPGGEYRDGDAVVLWLRAERAPAVRRVWREPGGTLRLEPRDGGEPLRTPAANAEVRGRLLSVLRMAA